MSGGGALLVRAGAACALLLAPWCDAREPMAGSVQAAEPRYWKSAELQTRPQIKTHVMPEYPRDLVSGIRGRVVLDLYISAAGDVDRVRVVRAEPRGRFDQAAVKAFKGARFTPGMRRGQPVPSLVRIEVSFGD